MGKKLTSSEINSLVKENPTTQMFDVCILCQETEEYGEMNSTEKEDSFDVICDECKKNNIFNKTI